MIKKVLIANRGEIALRILRACKELGIKTVAVHSEVDRNLKHVRLSDESICIGSNHSKDSYLNTAAIISACELTRADAVHPGYGFLSENADFVDQIENGGYKFIGPSSDSIRKMGNKITAIEIMKESGVPVVPGTGALPENGKEILKYALEIGYPVIIKASAGGGGRGMSIVYKEEDLLESVVLTKTEAKAAFGNDEVYLEKFLQHPRHVEVQIVADKFGNVIHLGQRDCSMQRKNQKVLEEAVAPDISKKLAEEVCNTCIEACKKIGYEGVGTFEFLYEKGKFFFIEMNTRLQVEHPVTEMVTGIDLVVLQLKIANGEKLEIKQDDVRIRGHAIECRINAEHPVTFLPSPGKIKFLHMPGGNGIRVDSHIYYGYVVPPYYDSMVAKIISYGDTREIAILRMKGALDEMLIDGITTNIDLHKKILNSDRFTNLEFDIHFIEDVLNASK
jgi:acetyl-CoA carboxylase biotin carboxylase subunit